MRTEHSSQRALKTAGTNIPVWDRRRPKTRFSGLLACACCGGGFAKISKDSFGCSPARNKGAAVCSNMRTIKQPDLEARVLDALANQLMDPEAVQVFCEEYTAERNRLNAEVAGKPSCLLRGTGRTGKRPFTVCSS